MEFALYDPQHGYYARRPRRSGRAGDFFTSVDVGPLFGELLEIQVAEMAGLMGRQTAIDLVEAGAGDGRLSADLLRAARRRHPRLYEQLQLHLVEASPRARSVHLDTLGDVSDRLRSSSDALPQSFHGVLLANELLDALPVHQVVMRDTGLREVYVDVSPEGELVTREGPLSTPALSDYLDRLAVALEPGWRVEINLRAVDWMRDAASRLRRGFIILIDYGHEARELYSAAHSAGTLTTFTDHRASGSENRQPEWLDRPGDQDITAHVDFSTIRDVAEREGLVTLGFLDQTYFVLGLMSDTTEVTRPNALKTLLMPGGLGSTHKVMIFGKNLGHPELRGCSFRQRVT